MQIDVVYCPAAIEDKLLSKHAVTVREVRQVLLSSPSNSKYEVGLVSRVSVPTRLT